MKSVGAIGVALLAALAVAQSALTVHVAAVPAQEVPPLSTSGFNFGNAMRVVGFEAEFEQIRIDSLRFPPGNQADEITLTETDLAALKLNLELLDHPPVLIVANLFGGTPAQAAELARLAVELDIPILAWEIGNEPDLYATNRNDPSWTPERYCAEFRRFREALLEVDADYRFAGPAVSGSRPLGEEYLRDVLLHCGDVIDILTWHIYPTDGTWSDDEAISTASSFGEEFRRYREWARDPQMNPLGYERPLEFGVTEFGLSWRSSSFRHLEDMTATLWLADVLGQMTAEGLDMSHYFTLQAMGGHGLIDVGGWVRPTYHLYRMLATFTGQSVPVTAPEPLGAYAVLDGNELQLLLINPKSEPVLVGVEYDGSFTATAQLTTLTEESFDTLGRPDTAVVDTNESIEIPARGVALFSAPVGRP